MSIKRFITVLFESYSSFSFIPNQNVEIPSFCIADSFRSLMESTNAVIKNHPILDNNAISYTSERVLRRIAVAVPIPSRTLKKYGMTYHKSRGYAAAVSKLIAKRSAKQEYKPDEQKIDKKGRGFRHGTISPIAKH